jgi:hypothetical protein
MRKRTAEGIRAAGIRERNRIADELKSQDFELCKKPPLPIGKRWLFELEQAE